MGLFDALLGQDGVNLVGGGLVGAPDDKMMETRFDEAGNAYQADVRAPLHPGHTTESSQRFGNIPKVEQPIEPSNLNYGDNYYSDTSFVPQNVAPTNNLVGTNTGVQTQHGRDIYQTDTGENVSEKSVTVPVNGKWVNAPSIHGGVRFTEDQVAQGIMSGQIQPTSVHDDLQEAVSVAQARSNNIQTNPMDLYNRQGRVDYIPQPMSFGRGGEEFVAQNQQATIAPWQPEQTDYTNARDVMSAYQGGERLAQRDTGTFQDLTPLEGFLIKADPSQAMEMLAMFKKEGRALTDLQFEKAMDSLGMSDILSEHRSTLNTVDKHYQDSVYGNTDDFGNPLNTDDFGNANYDQRVDNYANSLNNMTGINDVERVANVAKQPSSPSWLQKNQDITRQSQDFVRNLGGNIAEGATDFYEGAKELGSDAYQGAQDLYSDFYKPDTRTQMEKWQDAEDVSESIRTGITKGVGITKDLFMRGDEVVEKGFETAGDVLGPLASNWRSNLEKDTNVNPYVPGKDVLKQANVNFFDSTKTSLGDVADSVANPKQSLQGIADISSGALQHVLPDSMSWNEDDKAIASEVGKQIKEDWTTAEGFQKMLAERPVEVIPALYGAGILSRMGVDKTRDVLNDPRLLDNVEKMSMAIDPTNLGPSSQAVPGGIHPETKIDELGFYSEAENVVNKLKQETNHPDHIRQFMQKNGVTVDEMQDTGLLNYLQNAKANDERVTKTGLLAYINSKKTKLDETQHVGMGEDEAYEQMQRLDLDDPSYGEEGNFTVLDNEHLDFEVQEFMEYNIGRADVDYDDFEGIFINLNRVDRDTYFHPNNIVDNEKTKLYNEVSDINAKYPMTDGGSMPVDVHNHRTSLINKMEELERNKTSKGLGGMSEETIPEWWTKIEDAIQNDDFDSLPLAVKDDVEEAVRRMKNEQYLENPYYEWNVGIDGNDFIATGNEDIGIMIKGPDGNYINDDAAYSINEANIQIRDAAADYGIGGVGKTKYSDYTQPGLDASTYREIPIESTPLSGGDYRGPHFDEDNVVGHLRVSDRTDADGKNVLFIEELQSDWHQTGRKIGYKDKPSAEKLEKLEKVEVELDDEFRAIEDRVAEKGLRIRVNHDSVSVLDDSLPIEFQTIAHMPTLDETPVVRWHNENFDNLDEQRMKEVADVFDEYKEFNKRYQANKQERWSFEGSVPDAPLKNDKWQEMAFKRAIKIASDEGYDRVAWTNSQQQVDLYSDRYRELYENTYDNKIPGIANKLAKKHGSQTGTVEVNATDNNYIDITPELKEGIKGGQSMYGATSVAKPKKVDDGVLGQIGKADTNPMNFKTVDEFVDSLDTIGTGSGKHYVVKGSVKINDLELNKDGLSTAKGSFMWGDPKISQEPIKIVIDKNTGKKYLADGYHRYVNAQKTGQDELSAVISYADGVNVGKNGFENVKRFLTKSELTDIYNKAHSKDKVTDGLLKQEPLIVYRSSTSGGYDKFDKSKQRTSTLGKGVYMFKDEKGASDWVGENLQKIELPYDYMEKSINLGDGGQSDFVTKAFKKIEKEVDFKLDLEDDGIDVYPELVKKLDEDKAQALLLKHGIYGNRRDGELTTFNVDDAKIISTDKKKPKNGLLD